MWKLFALICFGAVLNTVELISIGQYGCIQVSGSVSCGTVVTVKSKWSIRSGTQWSGQQNGCNGALCETGSVNLGQGQQVVDCLPGVSCDSQTNQGQICVGVQCVYPSGVVSQTVEPAPVNILPQTAAPVVQTETYAPFTWTEPSTTTTTEEPTTTTTTTTTHAPTPEVVYTETQTQSAAPVNVIPVYQKPIVIQTPANIVTWKIPSKPLQTCIPNQATSASLSTLINYVLGKLNVPSSVVSSGYQVLTISCSVKVRVTLKVTIKLASNSCYNLKLSPVSSNSVWQVGGSLIQTCPQPVNSYCTL